MKTVLSDETGRIINLTNFLNSYVFSVTNALHIRELKLQLHKSPAVKLSWVWGWGEEGKNGESLRRVMITRPLSLFPNFAVIRLGKWQIISLQGVAYFVHDINFFLRRDSLS